MAHLTQRVHREQSSGLAVLLVSLYLMLLAFFLMLQSISTFDQQKALKAVSSLQNSFEYRISGPVIVPDGRAKSAPTIRDLYEELKKLLEPLHIEMELDVLDVRRNQLRMKVPIASLMSDTEMLNEDGMRIFAQLSALMRQWESHNIPVYLEMEFESTPLTQADGAHVRMAALAAQTLQENGVASERLAASVLNARGADMYWSVRMYHAE